jgi:predicted enzyme related to lactoylglutathione lyase
MKADFLALVGAALLLCGASFAQQPPAGAPQLPPTPVATPRILMLRLYVSDLVRAENFYHEVLGATVVQKMGDKVGIMTFPGGVSPGLILIQGPKDELKSGSFVIQVPDLEATLASAVANGGKVMTTRYSQDIQNLPAQSRHCFDPDGNDIEVLQIGKLK